MSISQCTCLHMQTFLYHYIIWGENKLANVSGHFGSHLFHNLISFLWMLYDILVCIKTSRIIAGQAVHWKVHFISVAIWSGVFVRAWNVHHTVTQNVCTDCYRPLMLQLWRLPVDIPWDSNTILANALCIHLCGNHDVRNFQKVRAYE